MLAMPPMPWVYATLRGQRVLAKANADGSFAADGGKVEIRYKPNDGRAYRATASNLERAGTEVLPEETVGEGAPVPSKAERSAQRKADAAASATRPGAVPDGAWTVYADGACSGNPGPAGLGVVLVSPDKKQILEGYKYLGEGTNNIAELSAILVAVALVPDKDVAFVHTDSKYSIGILQQNWKAKANQELIALVKKAITPRFKQGWKLVYVPGHSGVPLNERADELAREAVRTRSTRLPPPPG